MIGILWDLTIRMYNQLYIGIYMYMYVINVCVLYMFGRYGALSSPAHGDVTLTYPPPLILGGWGACSFVSPPGGNSEHSPGTVNSFRKH